MRRGVVPVVFVLLTALLACTGDAPTQFPSSDGGDGGAGPSSSGAAGLCPLGCLPIAPEGWTGPSAVYDGAPRPSPPPCGGVYTLAEVVRFGLGETEEGTCGCSSSTPENAGCAVELSYWPSNDCSGPPSVSTFLGNAPCRGVSGLGNSRRASLATPTGSCSTPTVKSTTPPPNLQREVASCGLSQAASCPERPDCTATPLPLPEPFNRLCIHRDGDVACPHPDYAVRSVVYEVVDTRECTCKTELEVDCASAGLGVHPTSECSSAPPPRLTAGECHMGNGVFLKPVPSPLASPTKCVVTAEKTGAVTGAAPVTFCCSK